MIGLPMIFGRYNSLGDCAVSSLLQ
jgi:hypothetical protein